MEIKADIIDNDIIFFKKSDDNIVTILLSVHNNSIYW